MSLNSLTLMGRLVRDPEYKTTPSGTGLTRITIAVDRDYSPGPDRETDFVDCVAFGKTAEFVDNYFTKGRAICVTGRLESNKWTDSDGKNRVSWSCVIGHAYFTDSKPADGYSNTPRQPEPAPAAPAKTAPATSFPEPPPAVQTQLRNPPPEYDDGPFDGDLPF